LEKAKTTLSNLPLQSRDYLRGLFGKVENLSVVLSNSIIKDIDMRAIQSMSDRLQVTIGPYWHGMSKMATKIFSKNSPLLYATGHTGDQIGAWMQKWCSTIDGYFLENDGKRWDAHLLQEAFKALVDFWKAMGKSPRLRSIYLKMVKTKGFTQLMHWYYTVLGTRKSGDSHTSLENTFINFMIHLMIMERCEEIMQATHPGITLELGVDYAVAAAGDDCIARISNRIPRQTLMQAISDIAMESGMEFTPKVSPDLFEVEFLSSLFYPVEGKLVLGPKIGRILSRIGWKSTPLTHKNETAALTHMRAVALGLERGVRFIPVLRALVQRVLQLTNDVSAKPILRDVLFKPLAVDNHTMDASTMAFVMDRYHVSAATLIGLERQIMGLTRISQPLHKAVVSFERDIS
jgi:hypothetical protein